jgi:hypothetical protein
MSHREDELEEVRIPFPLPLCQRRADVDCVLFCTKPVATTPTLCTFALQIGAVFVPIAPAVSMGRRHPRFDDHMLLAQTLRQSEKPGPASAMPQIEAPLTLCSVLPPERISR